MKIWHCHLGYNECNCGDKWLAMGAKNLMAKQFNMNLEDIFERKKEQSWNGLMETINNSGCGLLFIGGGGWLGDYSPLWQEKPSHWHEILTIPYMVYGIGYNAPRRHNKLPRSVFVPYIRNLKRIRKKSIFFSVRMDGTKEKLEDLGFRTNESPYPAFWIEPDKRPRILKDDYVILNIAGDGINSRYYENGIPPESFCHRVKMIVDFLVRRGYKVYFAKHVPSDGLCFNYINWNPEMVKILDWKEMLDNGLNFYQHAKMAIVMRGHAQIVPMALGIPVISMSSTDKNVGLVRKLGLSKYDVEVNNRRLSSNIVKLVNDIEDNPTALTDYYKNKINRMKIKTDYEFKLILDRLRGEAL